MGSASVDADTPESADDENADWAQPSADVVDLELGVVDLSDHLDTDHSLAYGGAIVIDGVVTRRLADFLPPCLSASEIADAEAYAVTEALAEAENYHADTVRVSGVAETAVDTPNRLTLHYTGPDTDTIDSTTVVLDELFGTGGVRSLPTPDSGGDHEPLPILDFDETSTTVSNTTIEDGTPIEHDGRAKTKTTFNPNEGEGPIDWHSLRKRQAGNRSLGSGERKREVDRQRDVGVVAGQVDLSPTQRDRAIAIVDEMNLVQGSLPAEAFVLGAVTIAANEDDRALRSGELGDEATAETWANIQDAWGVENSELREARKRIRNSSAISQRE